MAKSLVSLFGVVAFGVSVFFFEIPKRLIRLEVFEADFAPAIFWA